MEAERRHQRRWARARRRFRISMRPSDCFTVDVSGGGFCIEMLRALQPGTKVEGTIHAKGAVVPFSGVVVWATRGEPYIGVRSRMGVHFSSVAEGFEDLVAI